MTRKPLRSGRPRISRRFFRPMAELLESRIVPDSIPLTMDVPGLRTEIPGQGYLHFLGGDQLTGHIDIQNPAKDGTTDTNNGYDWSDNQVTVLTHNVTAPAGSTQVTAAQRQQDFNVANAVFAQAGITVLQEGTLSITTPTDIVQATFQKPDGSYYVDSMGKPLQEAAPSLSDLFGRGTDPGAVNEYYVLQIPAPDSGTIFGEALAPTIATDVGSYFFNQSIPALQGLNNGFAVDDATRTQPNGGVATFAHELGHFLLDNNSFATSWKPHSGAADDLLRAAPTYPDPTVTKDDGVLGLRDPGRANGAIIGQFDHLGANVYPNGGGGAAITQSEAMNASPSVTHADNSAGNGDGADFSFVEANTSLQGRGLADNSHSPPYSGSNPSAMIWGIGPLTAANTTGNNTGNWLTGGEPELSLGAYAQSDFRYVDVLSTITRNADMDVDATGNWSAREAALDYNIYFSVDNTPSSAWDDGKGTPVQVFDAGWTAASHADDYVTRWRSPIAGAKFVKIVADTANGHDGNTEIDAIIALPLTAAGLPIKATAMLPFTGTVAMFTDPNPMRVAADFSAMISWGDGPPSSGMVSANPWGGFRVSGSHTYGAPGSYTVAVFISNTPDAPTSVVAGTTASVVPDAPTGFPKFFLVNDPGDAPDGDLSDGVADTGSVSTGLTGIVTLRVALQNANLSPGPTTIYFAIGGGGLATIFVASTLPPQSYIVTIDGSSQPGFAGTPLIQLLGPKTADALTIANDSVVKDLAIDGFNAGIVMGAHNDIEGNYIGVGPSGTMPLGNEQGLILSGDGNTIGGTAAASGNLISSNDSYGIGIFSANGNLVEGNKIGTDFSGMMPLGNGKPPLGIAGGPGVGISGGSANTIGGTEAGAGNLISANALGVYILSGATLNLVAGNTIGLSKMGGPLPNTWDGVNILTSSFNTVGGTTAAAANIIAANKNNGITLQSSPNNLIAGNDVGTDAANHPGLGNKNDGVFLSGFSSGNVIGGMVAGSVNVISANSGNGIEIVGSRAGYNLVAGDFIGTKMGGTVALGNGANGILITGAPANTIGATAAGAGNVISANGQNISATSKNGIFLNGNGARGTVVLHNEIGTDITGGLVKDAGGKSLGNVGDGVDIVDGPGNVIGGTASGAGNIGGTAPGAANVISGNVLHGVEIDNSLAVGNYVQGNDIGTDLSGSMRSDGSGAPFGNGMNGVFISGGAYNLIGGTAPGAGNVISANTMNGVAISGTLGTGNVVHGNAIGTDKSGASALGNGADGVVIFGASGNRIGGVRTGARNVISGQSGNPGNGVEIADAGANVVFGNAIGTDQSGTVALANKGDGVLISTGPDIGLVGNLIGGPSTGARNIISANGKNGIEIAGAPGTVVQGNAIGTDQAGAAALANTGDGILISGAAGCTIGGITLQTIPVGPPLGARNVVSANGKNGIEIVGASGTVVQGDAIGTDQTGNLALGNTGDGILISGAAGCRIGGPPPINAGYTLRDFISANKQNGVEINGAGASGNLLQDNLIGTNATGTGVTDANGKSLGNGTNGVGDGILLQHAPANTIGGSVAAGALGNYISGNQANGIEIHFVEATGNLVQGNVLGAVTGSNSDPGNGRDGILINGANQNTIGGLQFDNTLAGGGNIIVANKRNGIELANASSTKVQGNFIGTNAFGTPSANTMQGVLLTQASSNNTIGGAVNGAGNTIGYNLNGVVVESGTSNAIRRNSIFSNQQLGIDLGNDGPTDNHNPEPTTGPNLFQNFPTITSVANAGTVVNGWLNSTANAPFTIELFANVAPTDPAGGSSRFLTSFSVTTDGAGNKPFTMTISALASNEYVTATATDGSGNTSEISRHRTPVLIVPDFGETFGTGFSDWLVHRGSISPDPQAANHLVVDPYTHVYDDLVTTLTNAGYVLGQDLFVATYDWRMPVAPNDGTPDGNISGLNVAQLTSGIGSGTYNYGVDYLGYWLVQAAQTYLTRFPNEPPPPNGPPPQDVDVIAHGLGGIVTRAYMQSPAYGGAYTFTYTDSAGAQQQKPSNLPKVHQFIMAGVPNQGASKFWNPIRDNWIGDPAYSLYLSKFLSQAYEKVRIPPGNRPPSKTTIFGPDGNITYATLTNDGQHAPDPVLFISMYVPALRALVPTYNFLDQGPGTVAINVNDQPDARNDLLLDLNAVDPNALKGLVTKKVVDLYGTVQSTPTHVQPGPGQGSVWPFQSSFTSSRTRGLQVWYLDRNQDLNEASGDGTVPGVSLNANFTADARLEFDAVSGVDHMAMVSNVPVENIILKALSLSLLNNQVSTGNSKYNYLELGKQIAGFGGFFGLFKDPVDGFLVDANGNRLGFSQATGAVTEIPNSEYVGDADGVGLVFGPIALPVHLELTGIGSDYAVQVAGIQDTAAGGIASDGTLTMGQQQSLSVPFGTADLAVTQTAPSGPLTTGSSLTYTLTASNAGPDPATDVLLTDTLPAGVSLTSASAGQGTFTQVGNTVTFALGGLASGAHAMVAITASVASTAAGTVTNAATLQAVQLDPNNEDNLSQQDTLVIPQFLVTPQLTNNTATAGSAVLVTVQAADSGGNPLNNFTGTVNLALTPADPQGSVPASVAITNGVGSFLANLKTVRASGTYTITATAGPVSGTSPGITVTPSSATHFMFTVPGTATTGGAISVTVTALDAYGNTATGYTGTVNLSSSDSAATLPVNHYTFTTGAGKDNGRHTFSVTLNTAGSQTIMVIDFGNFLIGVSAPIVTRGLVVTSMTTTSTGFVVSFSKPIDPTTINLYDATLTGQVANPGFVIPGSVFLSNNNQTLTFVATNLELPDDTYSLDLTSTGNAHPPSGAAVGFQDLSGAPLDGANNAGIADYINTVTTSYSSALTVSVAGFARGPGQPVNVDLVNFHHGSSTAGIPVQLSDNSASASFTTTSVSFTMSYSASWLTVSNVSNGASPQGGTYSVATAGVGASATATFTWTNSGGLTLHPGDVLTVGQLGGSVPSGAAYKSKGVLNLGTPTVLNSTSPVPSVGQNAVQVVTFLGDGSGLGSYSTLDASLMANFANTGALFPSFPLADPNLIAGIDGAIDPNSISQVLQINLNKPVPGIPAYTGAPSNNPAGPDPALAVGSGQWAVGSGQITVPVNIDDPHPAGSTGLMLATLALSYDPRVFSVSPQDVHLGTVPRAGTGWILAAPLVDASKGQIGITLYSTTPISVGTAGSLVTIDFHVLAGASLRTSSVQLVAAVNPGGQMIQTTLADGQGFLTLHQGPSSTFVPGLDGRVLVTTTLPDPVTGKPAEVTNGTLELPAERRLVVPAEEGDFMTGMVLAAEAEAAPALVRVFLAGLSAASGFPTEGGVARAAGVFPGMIGPGPQRLLELVLGEPSYRLGTSIRRREWESVLWSSLQDGSDWLTDLDGGALGLPRGKQGEKSEGPPAPSAAASTAADDGAWAEYLAETGEELG